MLANILVIDLEATCADDDSIPPEQMEVLEVGAVWVSPSGEILDRFQSFVRPIEQPQLTAFCKRLLSHIDQASIDTAPTWPAVAAKLAEFAQHHQQPSSWWGSWGAFDRNQIARESARHGIADPLTLPHQNLKKAFAKARRIKQVGMATALQIVGLPLEGDHHRALDDALNVARLLPCCAGYPAKAVVVQAAGNELVAALPDGRQLHHKDADELARLLLAEGVSADDVRMPDWREGECAPTAGQKLAIWDRMRAARQR